MTYPDTIRDYLTDLQLDLSFNKKRLEDADPKAVPVILRNIKTLESEIKKYSEMIRK